MPDVEKKWGRSLLWLCLKFAVLAPICLILWLLLLPYYASLITHVSAFVLRVLFHYPISTAGAVAGGFLNTGTTIEFHLPGVTRSMPDLGRLTTNLAPFIALTLATTGITMRRRLGVLLIGTPIILLSHLITIIFRFTEGRSPLPTAIGFISITLPFLLWIVLAYWEKLAALLQEKA